MIVNVFEYIMWGDSAEAWDLHNDNQNLGTGYLSLRIDHTGINSEHEIRMVNIRICQPPSGLSVYSKINII